MTSRFDTFDRGLTKPHRMQRVSVLHGFAFTDVIAFAILAALLSALDMVLMGQASLQALKLLAVGAVAMLALFNAKGHYRLHRPLGDQIGSVTGGFALTGLFTGAVLFSTGLSDLSWALPIVWAVGPVLIMGLRYSVRQVCKATGQWGEAVTVLAPIRATHDPHAVLSHDQAHGLWAECSIALEPMDSLSDEMLHRQLDAFAQKTVFLAPDASTQAIASRLASLMSLRGQKFYYRPAMGELPHQSIELMDFPPADGLIMAVENPQNRPLARMVKRTFDIVGSALGLLALMPVLGVIFWAVRRDGGPALFEQARLGANGTVFKVLKFRTMVVDAEARLAKLLAEDPEKAAQWEAFQKLNHDPRITFAGRLLRKTSLDELPQLINVLRGDMSLVGPRPMMADQRAEYGPAIIAYERMRPGLTGLWQVNGRNATTFAERARQDAWYARNWSLWRDMVIIVRTVREVLKAGGQ